MDRCFDFCRARRVELYVLGRERCFADYACRAVGVDFADAGVVGHGHRDVVVRKFLDRFVDADFQLAFLYLDGHFVQQIVVGLDLDFVAVCVLYYCMNAPRYLYRVERRHRHRAGNEVAAALDSFGGDERFGGQTQYAACDGGQETEPGNKQKEFFHGRKCLSLEGYSSFLPWRMVPICFTSSSHASSRAARYSRPFSVRV